MNRRVEIYIYQYLNALRDTNGVVVYTDESYLHQRKGSDKIWWSPIAPESRWVTGDSNGGRRVIVLHAMTSDGLLAMPGAVSDSDLRNKCLTAELVFEAHTADGDYHKCMNGESFMAWLSNRLIPTFQAQYPGKKMYLVLDNVKYHHHRGITWHTLSTMNRTMMVSFLENPQLNKEYIPDTICGLPTFVNAGTKHKPKPVVNPQLKKFQLKLFMDAHFKAHPQVTEVAKLFKKHNYTLLYTPPYVPELQPIESLWGTCKKSVAALNNTKRTVHELVEQIKQSFNTIDANNCRGYISRSQHWIDDWISNHTDSTLHQYENVDNMLTTPAWSYGQSLHDNEVMAKTLAVELEDDEEDPPK